MKRKLFDLVTGLIFGAAIILGAIFIPASEVIRIMFIVFGLLLIGVSILNLIYGWFSMFGRISSIIGIILGLMLIFVHNWIISVIVAIYFVAIPLINHLIFQKNWDNNDLIKLFLGIIYLVFTPLSVVLFDKIVQIALIGLGIMIIIGAIMQLTKDDDLKKLKHNNKDVDYDFSDK